MKTLFNIISILVLLLSLGCEKDEAQPPEVYSCTSEVTDQNPGHHLAGRLQTFMDSRIAAGLPGVMMTVHDPVNGRWSGAAGRAELIGKVPLRSCHITRVGSTVKTFTAVSVLRLWEEGKIELEAPITDYLSDDQLRGLGNADQATVRQLLQHSSGMDNYIRNLRFQTASLNDFTRVWQPEELLAYSRDVPAEFPAGSDVNYSNTGYILLGMIIEAVTGKAFYKYFEEALFTPYHLEFTRFAALDPVPDGIIRGYIDLYDKGELIEATYYSGWDYFTADGGLISNSYDLNRFLELLFSGQIIGPEALAQMTDFQYPKVEEADAFRTGYGLGIFSVDTDYGPAYLHSGDAIGYFASMAYFPEQQVTISWAANGNYGTLDAMISSRETMEEIFALILE